MFVARFTNTPNGDEERGWSGYFAPFFSETVEALEFFGFLPDEWEDMSEEELNEVAEDNFLQRDEQGQWRPYHHNGLSCWSLESDREDSAECEAKALLANLEIEWAGFGQAAINAKWVKCIDSESNLHLFICDRVETEV